MDSSYLIPNSSSETLPINPTYSKVIDRKIEFAKDLQKQFFELF